MQTIYHPHIYDHFRSLVDTGKLHHAYVFVGPRGSGKQWLVREVVALILGMSAESLERSPDFYTVSQEQDEKTGKTKKDITIQQMHQLRAFLSQRPFGAHKVALVNHAELLNTNAANAFLKTLEEPTRGAVIFLTCENEELLPLTIRSRCQQIYVPLVSVEKITQMFSGLDAEQRTLAAGRPGLLMEWESSPEQYESYRAEFERFSSLLGKSFHDKIETVSDLFGDKTDHIAARTALIEVLAIWQQAARVLFTTNTLEASIYLRVMDRITYAQKHLRMNIHPRLLVEHILLAF